MFFFFNDTATTEIYTLSLHDALPISSCGRRIAALVSQLCGACHLGEVRARRCLEPDGPEPWAAHDRSGEDRKSTRLNSSHANISYAVFCLKKKKNDMITIL